MDYATVTPLVQSSVNWVQYAPYEPNRVERKPFETFTRSAQSKDDAFTLFNLKTGAEAPTFIHDARLERSNPRTVPVSEFSSNANPFSLTASEGSEIDRIAKQRVKLIAAKYANSNASAEIVARLEILNQRLLDRSPRISTHQLEAIENAGETLVRIRAAREDRARRLGIAS